MQVQSCSRTATSITSATSWRSTSGPARPSYAHEEERAHVEGRYPYTGLSPRLRLAGNRRPRFRAAAIPIGTVDRTFADGDVLPFWGGLRVVHLPGHTRGPLRILQRTARPAFQRRPVRQPIFLIPTCRRAILNSVPERISPDSFRRVAALDPRWIVPNHYDLLDGARLRRRFDRLHARQDRR